MTRHRFVLLGFGLLVACSGNGLPSGEPDPAVVPPGRFVPRSLGCQVGGDFDFDLTAVALEPWEGRQVRVVALEPPYDPDAPRSATRIAVDVATRVEGGRVRVTCAGALTSTFSNPSFAMFVDADGDGRCGANDIVGTMRFIGWEYGWDYPGTYTLPRVQWDDTPSRPTDWKTAGETEIPSEVPTSFCEAYFP